MGDPQGQRELIISYLCSHGILHTHAYMHTLTRTRTCRHIHTRAEGQTSRQIWGHRRTFSVRHGRAEGPSDL